MPRDNDLRTSGQRFPSSGPQELRIGVAPDHHPPPRLPVPYSAFGVVDNSIWVHNDDVKLIDTTDFNNPI